MDEARIRSAAGFAMRAGIPWAVLTDMGNAIGKYGRKVAAVTDNGFARMLTAAMEADGTNQHGGV